MDVRGARVAVLGLGASGTAAARLAAAAGADVVGLDLRTDVAPIAGVRLELGPHRRETFLESDVVVVSPGVPAAAADVVAAQRAGKVVVGELGFAHSFLHDPVVIGVTGTNGKSTVTWFTGQLLEAAGRSAFVGGNLGRPLSQAVLDGDKPDVFVIEVSSYQLELPGEFSPSVGVILNLTPDHLKRHKTMEGYAAAKAELFARMGPGDLAILPAADERLAVAAAGLGQGTRLTLGALPGARRDGRQGTVRFGDTSASFDLSGVAVPGEHNLDNALTAALLALAVGVDDTAVQRGLSALEPLDHRMEVVANRGGVLWINDSKATNVDATRVGVSGIDRPAVVLLGGQAKEGGGFAALVPDLGRHRAVITFGGSGDAIADELQTAGFTATRVKTMADAVHAARSAARSGDAVLLSPGCASFDAFDNFEHRGRVFRDLVTGGTP